MTEKIFTFQYNKMNGPLEWGMYDSENVQTKASHKHPVPSVYVWK